MQTDGLHRILSEGYLVVRDRSIRARFGQTDRLSSLAHGPTGTEGDLQGTAANVRGPGQRL